MTLSHCNTRLTKHDEKIVNTTVEALFLCHVFAIGLDRRPRLDLSLVYRSHHANDVQERRIKHNWALKRDHRNAMSKCNVTCLTGRLIRKLVWPTFYYMAPVIKSSHALMIWSSHIVVSLVCSRNRQGLQRCDDQFIRAWLDSMMGAM